MRSSVFLILLSVLMIAVVLTGCSCSDSRSSSTNVEIIQDMMDQPAIKPQGYDGQDRNIPGSRLPPEGSVPVGFKPYLYRMNPAAAEKALKNPLAGNAQVLEVGRTKFEIYCAVCHGAQGDGKGTVAPKMSIQVPSLLTDKVRSYNDGRIFHIITDGQGVMQSYAYQVTNENDRWAIVNYIRSLQKLAAQGQ